MDGIGKLRLILGVILVSAAMGLTACNNDDNKNSGGPGQGANEECPEGKLCLPADDGETEETAGEETSEDEATEDDVADPDDGSSLAPRRSPRPVARPEDVPVPRPRPDRGNEEVAPELPSNINVIYYDELSAEAKRRLQVVLSNVDTSRGARKVMAQKDQRSTAPATWFSRTDPQGNRFSKRIISEVYNSHGCSVANEGFCLVIENNKISVMGVVMGTNPSGKKVTQIQSTRFKQRTREMDVFVQRLRGQRVVISPFSHANTNQRLARDGAGFDRSSSPQGLRITGICGIEGRLNMSDKGALLVGAMKGTTQATSQFPEQYARISCLSFGKPIRPLRVVIDLEGHWVGVKLQFSAWFRGTDVSYDQWDFGATGLGVIPGPIGLLTPPGTQYGLLDLSADLLVGSLSAGTGVFARKNNRGPNTFVIPFYLKGENGIGDIGLNLEGYSLRLTAHPDEF